MNILKSTELYTLNGWVLCCLNDTSIKNIIRKKENCLGCRKIWCGHITLKNQLQMNLGLETKHKILRLFVEIFEDLWVLKNILAASGSVDHLHTPGPSVSPPRVAQAPLSQKPNARWRRRAAWCSVHTVGYSTPVKKLRLQQRPERFFCKGPNSEYFWFHRPYGLCHSYSAVLL